MSVSAQFQMPDAKQMSGIPRPVDDLPAGSISVRLIRGSLSNNITNHPVELHVGSRIERVRTDESGRAQFDKVPGGATVKASADVDGEHLESQEFTAPPSGGIRLMLVATDTSKGAATEPGAPAVSGLVAISNQSRIVIEPSDESVNVYYLIDISNTARAPVNPSTPFVFDVPKEALGTGLMEGSSPQASVTNGRVAVQGPFAPGHTPLQVAFSLPSEGGSIQFAQTFPASVESLAVIAKKVGDMTLSGSPLTAQREMPAQGEMFIAATGGTVNAGRPITLSIDGLPHHSGAPRFIALSLAIGIILAAVWASGTPSGAEAANAAAERKRLLTKRDKLLNELVRLESDRRSGRAQTSDDRRYFARREELVSALEQIYGALDSDDIGPAPADGAGLAA
jgi:hypothetical protein